MIVCGARCNVHLIVYFAEKSYLANLIRSQNVSFIDKTLFGKAVIVVLGKNS